MNVTIKEQTITITIEEGIVIIWLMLQYLS